MHKFALLDRDGTIIEDTGYPRDPAQVKLLPFAAEGMRLLVEKGYTLFVVSNQSGVGRGIISDTAFWNVHQKVCQELKDENVLVCEFFYCLHHPLDPCLCRKPKTGLIPKSWNGVPIPFGESIVVGDKESDLLLAKNLGAKAYLVKSGNGKQTDADLQSRKEEGIVEYESRDTLLDIAKELPTV